MGGNDRTDTQARPDLLRRLATHAPHYAFFTRLATVRWRFFGDSFARALASVTLGGVIIVVVSAALGTAA